MPGFEMQDVMKLVQDYASGKYENTGFLIKALGKTKTILLSTVLTGKTKIRGLNSP
jgi:hypothetical protein